LRLPLASSDGRDHYSSFGTILDRLIHSSHKLVLKGESMRKLKAGNG
jgi:hypothetical protein